MWARPPGSAPGHAPAPLPPPPQAGGGRAGTWRPDRRTGRTRGRRPGAPASRGPEVRGPDPSTRAACAGLGRAAAVAGGRAGLLPQAGGGIGEGEGRRALPRAGSGPGGASCAAAAAARPREGYLLHGSLDGGVWGLGLLQQLQDLLKSLLVRFPLILHFGLLQIKPETGRDGANVTTPRAQARGLPAPSSPFLLPRTTPALPRRLGPVWAPRRKSPTAKPGGPDPGSSAANICCSSRRGRRAQGADQTESPRICNLAPDPLLGVPGS